MGADFHSHLAWPDGGELRGLAGILARDWRRLLPVGAVVTGAIFLFFGYWMTRGTSDDGFFFLSIPAALFIIYSNARLTRVCQECGTAHGARNFLTPAAFCRKCGTRLDA